LVVGLNNPGRSRTKKKRSIKNRIAYHIVKACCLTTLFLVFYKDVRNINNVTIEKSLGIANRIGRLKG